MVQLVRVADSSNNEYCLEAVTPTTDQLAVNSRHIAPDGSAITAIGRLMTRLVDLEALSEPVIWKLSNDIRACHPVQE